MKFRDFLLSKGAIALQRIKSRFSSAVLTLATITLAVGAAGAARADVMYAITVDTSSLTSGDYIDLQFNPANSPQSGTAFAFNYAGPNLNVTPSYMGSASGDLPTPGATLMNSGGYNDYNQEITSAGNTLTFDLEFSGPEIDNPAGNNGVSTFALSFFSNDDATPLLDNENNDASGDILEITIGNNGMPTTLVNSTDITVGGPATASATPEPSCLLLAAVGIGFLVLGSYRKKKSAAVLSPAVLVLIAACGVVTSASAQTATMTSLSLSSSEATEETAVRLTASTKADGKPVSPGQIFFYDGKTLLGTEQLQLSGTAEVMLRFGPGVHSLTASFAGTKAYVKSSSGDQSLTVKAALATSTTVSASGSNSYTLTATVTGSGLPAPSGSVTFSDQTNKVALGSTILDAPTTAQTFQPQTIYATGRAPDSVAVADFNGDGIPDLAIANAGDDTVGVLLGRGDGAFRPQTTYGAGYMPGTLVTADFNGDGIADLAVVSNLDNGLSVLLGKGDGTFQPQSNYGVGNGPTSAAVGDFNGDGIADLAVTSTNDNTVRVLLGNGDGTFQTQTAYATGGGPESVAVGDFNNDGIVDMTVANFYDNTISVLLGKGDGTFQAQTTYESGGYPFSITVSDLNGDGIPDLAAANYYGNSVSVLLGKGDGTFDGQVYYVTGSGPTFIAAGDFNGDGIPDLATANDIDNTISVLLGNGDGTFQLQTTYGSGNFPASIGVGDFNGDGLLDLAVANGNDYTLGVLLNSVTHATTATMSNVQIVGAGAHSIQAAFPGLGDYAPSNGTVILQASALATTLSLSASSTVPTGENVQLVASISPYAHDSLTTNGEMVTFKEGTSVLGTALLNNGTAILSVNFSAPGSYGLQAFYGGDTNFAPGSSNSATVVVTGSPTATPANVQVTYTGAVYNRATKLFNITFTLTNNTSQTIAGPISLLLSGLPAGVSPSNSNGAFSGNPYWSVTNSALASGASVSIQVEFSDPSNTAITFTPQAYSGVL